MRIRVAVCAQPASTLLLWIDNQFRQRRTRLDLDGGGVHAFSLHGDPFTTLQNALRIGGGQWAGKSTVAGILAAQYGLVHYHYDYHDARGHLDRRIAQQLRRGETPTEPDAEDMWVRSTVEQAVDQALSHFIERFEYVQDDLRGLTSPNSIIADGWGLRPELVAPLLSSTQRMVVMVPTEEFRRLQLRELPRAAALRQNVSDPQLAQQNRLARDRRHRR